LRTTKKGSVFAEENITGESTPSVNAPFAETVVDSGETLPNDVATDDGSLKAETVVDSREMLPGDVATDDGSLENDSTSETLQVESLFTPRLTAPSKDNDYYFAK